MDTGEGHSPSVSPLSMGIHYVYKRIVYGSQFTEPQSMLFRLKQQPLPKATIKEVYKVTDINGLAAL